MLEVSAIPQGVAHILVVRTLGVEDVVQRSLASVGCPSGTRDGWSGGVDLFMWPLLPTLIGLLVRVAPWCGWCRFCSPDEVLSLFVSSDVEVRFSKQLLEGDRRLLQYGSDEGRVIRSPVEVFNHRCLSDFGDTVSHGLESLEVRPKCFLAPAPDGFEVPWLRRFVGERLKVGNEAPTKVATVVDTMSWKVSQPLQCILSENDGQVRSHHVFSCPSGLGGDRIDGQPTSRVLLRLILVDVGDLEVRGPLNGPEMWSKCGYFTCVLLSTFIAPVLGRRVADVPSQSSPGRTTS
jgi:hypothetical protein